MPRKATHCLQKEVGQNIKDKKRDKRAKTESRPGKGVLIEEVSNHQETFQSPSHWWVWGKFSNLRAHPNWEEK